MAAYAQFGYGYPSANQLLAGAGVGQAVSNASATGIPSVTTAVGPAPSPLSGANEASLSPSGGSATTGVTTGPLSPGAISQTSNHAGSSGIATAAALSIGESLADPGAVGGSGAAVSAAAAAAGSASGGTSCCENGRPIMTDPVSGQTVCSCQYDSARLALSSYSRMPAAGVGVYGTPYPSSEQNPYPSIGVDSSAFYSPLSNPYALKESGPGSDMTAWTSAGLQPTTGYYSYDPTLAAYGYGAGYDLAARRKNATRESTATLKAWLNEHKKNPYPTKGEKIMLAIITKMTLTQVSTWFANARRRLKKENKMTWEPKNKTEDDDDAMLSDDEKEKDSNETEKIGGIYGSSAISGDHHKDGHHVKSELGKVEKEDSLIEDERKPENLTAMRGLDAYNAAYGHHAGYNPYQQQQQQHLQQQQHPSTYYEHGGGGGGGVISVYGAQESTEYGAPKNPMSRDCGIPIPATKPKIWSLADTVACKTPPPAAYMGQQYYQHQLQQQQQQLSQGNSSSSGGSMLPQPQTQQTQLHPHPAHNSPLNMMNSYVGGSPYSRIPTGYAGPTNYSSSNSSSNTGMPTTPTTPPTMHVLQQQTQQLQAQAQAHHYHQQQQQQQQQHQHLQQHLQQQQQQRMGFPEIQPDTPPQTPPNMKLANSGSGSSTANPLHAGPAAIPTAGMCYSNNGVGGHAHSVSYDSEMTTSGIGVSIGGNSFVGQLAAARAEA